MLAQLRPYYESGLAQLRSGYVQAPSGGEIVIVTEVDTGNIDHAAVTVTGGATAEPFIELAVRTSSPKLNSWTHVAFAVENAAGKRPIFRLSRAGNGMGNLATTWRPAWTQDGVNWTLAPSRTYVTSPSPGYVEWQFTDPLPAGHVHIASGPVMRQSDSEDLAAYLLTQSNVSPTASADENGVYHVSPSETDDLGRQVGGHPMFAVKLSWPQSTTDGGRKRKLVLLGGTHAAGEGLSLWEMRAFMLAALNDAGLADFRANWDVYCYWNLTPNGLYGGSARYNFRSGQNPNRGWDLTTNPLEEVNVTRTAILTDTGGSADIMFSWHGTPLYSSEFTVWTNAENVAPETREPIYDAVFSGAGTKYGQAPGLQPSTNTGTTSTWAKDVLSARMAVTLEYGLPGTTDPTTHTNVGAAWAYGVQHADAQGLFVEGAEPGDVTGALAATEQADTISATGEVEAAEPSGAIAFIGSAAAGTEDGWPGLPAHQTGDLLLAFSFHDGTSTLQSIPAGFTEIHRWGSSSCNARLAYRFATSAAETIAPADWGISGTGATRSLHVHVYRGVDADSPIGAFQAGSGAGNYPALSFEVGNGTSWAVGFSGHRSTDTALETPPSGMALRDNVLTASIESSGFDTLGGVPSWDGDTVAIGGTVSGNKSITLELRAAVVAVVHEGALAATETADGFAAAGVAINAGLLIAAEAQDALAAAGSAINPSTLEAEEPADSFAASGLLRVNGDLSASEPADAIAASGLVLTVGALAATEQSDAIAAQGIVASVGALSATETADAFASSGVVTNYGALDATETGDRFIASVASFMSGLLDADEASDSASFAGSVIEVGSLAATEAPDTFEGRTFPVGAMSAFEDADAFAAEAVQRLLGAMDAHEEIDGYEFVGDVLAPGAMAAVEARDGFEAAGRIIVPGILSATEAPDRFSATPPKLIPDMHRMAPTALRLITKHGQPVTLRVVETGEYNPALGSVERTEVDYAAVGVRMDYEQRYIDGTTIQRGDQRLLVPPQGIPKPETGNQIVMGGKPFAIVNVGTIDPDGKPALYELQLRGVA